MDELSLFRNAPTALVENEIKLMALSDLVFTGGISLFEAKRKLHPSVYPFPSSVDCKHFAQARALEDVAEDQKHLPRPRLGYAGVIDERIDLDLIREIARRRPDWHIVMIGPVVKIDAAALPNDPNIHWLGMKSYSDLPVYLAGWDVALMPFAINESTRFISPTKTPEYLAAGLPVVSTPIRDVKRQYGELGLVQIEGTPDGFLAAIEQALTYDMGLKWRARGCIPAKPFLGSYLE
jgi:glycosyltransferase involved in cell wall biosynthesis